jgi:hypothetical protein
MEHSESISDELARLAEQTDDDELSDDIQNLATVASSLGPGPVPLLVARGAGQSTEAQRMGQIPEVVVSAHDPRAIIAPAGSFGADVISETWFTSVYQPSESDYERYWDTWKAEIEQSETDIETALDTVTGPELFTAFRRSEYPSEWQNMDYVEDIQVKSGKHSLTVPTFANTVDEVRNEWCGRVVQPGGEKYDVTYSELWEKYQQSFFE